MLDNGWLDFYFYYVVNVFNVLVLLGLLNNVVDVLLGCKTPDGLRFF